MGRYLSWAQPCTLKPFGNKRWILRVHDGTKKSEEYLINNSAAEIIMLFDGTKTLKGVISCLAEKYSETEEKVRGLIGEFLNEMKSNFQITLREQDQPALLSIGMQNLYPSVCSLEITTTCNLKCLHCYGDFGNRRQKRYLTFEQAKIIIDQLHDIGVEIIEITGGEPTTNPYFALILEYACKCQFKKVVVLTNGILINKAVVEIASAHRDQVLFQIDLHSLDDDYLYWFTGFRGTLSLVQGNILALTQRKIFVRIVMTVTKKNIHEIESVAAWGHGADVRQFAISLVTKIGRAANVGDDSSLFVSDTEEAKRVTNQIKKISDRYPEYVHLPDCQEKNRNNCACVTSHTVIDSAGNIKICTMDNLEYANSSLGNVLETPIREIYNKSSEYLQEFAAWKAPDKDSDYCKECANALFCHRCLLRGIIASGSVGQCAWRDAIPDVIRKKLYL